MDRASLVMPVSLPLQLRGRGVTAVLGPTNTGKTHYAIERMLAHPSGIIGLPLRLLAREVYGRVAERVGADQVALVTGEEKIKPPNPRFWVCTVEAMPRDVDASFVAIDEIQIAADLERGHVFTDRLLNRRGRDETLLLGAGTMRGIVQRLIPGANIVTRPRLSTLTYAGEKKITRQPPRTAIVAFSADEVYAIAELVRRQRGGAAVVLGALSPRTRNAQVALYQSGDVDVIVATDAIGMGLNLDVDHVAFAGTRKFDGFTFRNLNPAELAQIAGRAGRHMRDGTFGTTGRADPFESDLAQKIESHDFEPVKLLQWRNPDPEFGSLGELIETLARPAREEGLTRAPSGDDVAVLDTARRDPAVSDLLRSARDVRLLWEAAQLPDYRKVSLAAHAELCLEVFGFLARRGTIPPDWLDRRIRDADKPEGDLDTLSTRIAHMRTWSFIANRPDWLDDPEHWRERTRALEDRLSDALHERLTQRFVDRRTGVLMRRLREKAAMEASISDTGDVLVEGQHVGRLQGFQFTPDPSAEAVHGKALRQAASQALAGAIAARAEKVSEAGNDAFVLASNGGIRWMGEEIARLSPGDTELEPRARLLADESLTGQHRDWVQGRVDAWLRHHVGTLLKPLFDLRAGAGLEGIARGIAFQLVEALGVLERSRVAEEVKGLDQPGRAALRTLGVRFGAYHLFVPATMKPKPRELAAQLWALKHGGLSPDALREVPQLAGAGRTSIPVDAALPKALYRVVGYRVLGPRAVRVDILERLADIIRPLIAYRPGVTPGAPPKGAAEGDGFVATVEMTSLVGCAGEDFAAILKALGYRVETRPLADHEATLAAAQAAAEAAEAAKTAAAVAAAPASDATAADQATEPAAETPPEAETVADAPEPAVADATPVETVLAEPVTAEPAAVDPAPTEAAAVDTVPAEAPAAEAAVPAPPATIDIWRPARFERRERGAPRGREERRGPRRDRPAAAAGAPAADGSDAPRRDRPPRPEGAPGGERRPGRPDRGERRDEARKDRRPDRPPGDRPQGDRPPRRDDRGPRRDERPRGGEREARVFTSAAPKAAGPDLDNPFAKLLALKEQMEKKS